jgi:hypothetical protein
VPAALSSTAITFSGSTYACASVTVRDSAEQLDVTTLTDTQRQYQNSPLKNAAEATLEFMGYGPRAGATGAFTAPGVSGLGATVTSSSTTFAVNNIIRSQATIQFSR